MSSGRHSDGIKIFAIHTQACVSPAARHQLFALRMAYVSGAEPGQVPELKHKTLPAREHVRQLAQALQVGCVAARHTAVT